MAISEIEKLERRYAENPQGLIFASLAEAYRKSGDPARALGILRPGLELHPDYIPASIVLGRCHLDLGNEGDAEAAFVHVVALDPENVIALKSLADVTERAGRYGDAAERLQQLLEVDRSNEDAQAQLARVLAAKERADAEPVESVVDDAPLTLAEPAAALVEPEDELLQQAEPTPEAMATPEPLLAMDPPPPPPPFDPPVLDPSPLFAESSLGLDAPAEEPAASVPDVDSVFGALLGEPPAADGELAVQQFGGDDLVLEGRDHGEFQIASASESLAEDGIDLRASLSSEYQQPDASSELSLEPKVEASEFQTPDASSSLLEGLDRPEVQESAAEVPAEPIVASSGYEFFASAVTPVIETPVPPTDVVEAIDDAADAEDDEPIGEWETWADAALDPDAPPFEDAIEETEAFEAAPTSAPEPWVAPEAVPSAPTMEVIEAPEQADVEPVFAAEPSHAEPEFEAAPADVEPMAEAPQALDEPRVEAAHVADELPVAAIAASVPEPAVPPAPPVAAEPAEPDLVVTESMAELFVRQGHAGDALRIYRELAGRRPGDARLVERIAELEALEAASRVPAAPYAARVTGGVSARELMRSILSARPNGRAAATPPPPPPEPLAPRATEPTRPAQDSISLSDVFGDEGGATLPPTYRPPRPPAGDKGVSFDEFFGAPQEPHSSSLRQRGPRPPADDLDQFHAWLQNLKR